jgi:hypothetical protein
MAKKPTSIVHQTAINQLLSASWGDLPDQLQEQFAAAAVDTAGELLGSAGLVPTEDQWNVIDEKTRDLALDRAGELIGLKQDAEGNWIENPNAKWTITEDTRDEVTNLVAQAEEENWSNDQLREAIVNADLFSEGRADMIARTELKRIDAMSADATASATGATSKRWLLSSDHNEADECDSNADADWVDIDDGFPSGADLPPEHPNCMCVVTFGWENPETGQEEETGEEE